MARSIACFLVSAFLLLHTGCGDSPSAPDADELSQYVSENPHSFDSGATIDSGDITK